MQVLSRAQSRSFAAMAPKNKRDKAGHPDPTDGSYTPQQPPRRSGRGGNGATNDAPPPPDTPASPEAAGDDTDDSDFDPRKQKNPDDDGSDTSLEAETTAPKKQKTAAASSSGKGKARTQRLVSTGEDSSLSESQQSGSSHARKPRYTAAEAGERRLSKLDECFSQLPESLRAEGLVRLMHTSGLLVRECRGT